MTQDYGASLHIRMLARSLLRRWWMVAGATTLAGLVALSVGVMVPPRYTAKAQIVLDQASGERGARFDDIAIQTWVELMSTASHIRRLHESFDSDPLEVGSAEFERPALTELAERARSALAAARAWTSQADEADEAVKESAAPAQRMPNEDELERQLRAFKERQSRILSITFTWTDPHIAAAIANRSAEVFLGETLRQQQDERQQALEALRGRIVQVRGDLLRAGVALAEYRVEHGVADPDRADQIDAQIAEVNRQLAIAGSDLASHRPLAALDGVAALAMHVPTAAQGGPGAAPASSLDAAILERRVRYLAGRLAALQAASAEARSAEASLRDLRLQAGAMAQSYGTLLNQEAELRDGPVQPLARIVSVAAPPRQPSSPDPIFFVPPGLVIGAIGGGLLAVLFERIDRRVRSERTAEAALGVRCIGVVPKVRRMGTLRPLRALLDEPFAPYTKAIRSIAMAVLGLPGEQRAGKVILVTSSGKGEGKTALAVSFGSYAALLRRKVVVVDFDLPSPSLGRLLRADDGPGGLDVLRGTPLTQAIRSSATLGIDYLPLTSGQIDPLLLMADDRTRVLLDELRQRYDCVIIDSAPIIGNAEVRALIALADQVILTLKSGSTDLDMARAAMSEIRKVYPSAASNASVSLVITQVEPGPHETYSAWANDDPSAPRPTATA